MADAQGHEGGGAAKLAVSATAFVRLCQDLIVQRQERPLDRAKHLVPRALPLHPKHRRLPARRWQPKVLLSAESKLAQSILGE